MKYKLGLDGYVVYKDDVDLTCPASSLCDFSEEGLSCTFKNLLPSGPLWDMDKEDPNNGVDGSRTTMAAYAAYLGKVFHSVIRNSLWASIRESQPWTAVTTLDDWLIKLNWRDCYGACRDVSLTNLSPFEIMTECGPVHCPPEYPIEYERALKSAMVKSLYRMRLGFTQNIAGFDYVLEPLGARVEVSWKDDIPPQDGECRPDLLCLTIVKASDRLLVPKLHCEDDTKFVPPWVDMGCGIPMGLPQFVWPGLVAAECILRSMIPMNVKCILPTPCYEPDNI